MAQADEQTAEHAHTYRNNHAEETQIVRKFTVEDKAGKQGARHAHASVNGQINAAQHNDKGQSQGHYQGQGHLVENIHNILGGEEAGPTDNEKDNHKTGQHDQRCQLHHFALRFSLLMRSANSSVMVAAGFNFIIIVAPISL